MPNAYSADGETENSGEAQTDVRYRRIRIWVAVADRSRREIEQTIVHELLHSVFNSVGEAWEPAADRLAFSERSIVGLAVKRAEEGHIENLAQVLVALSRGRPVEHVSEGLPGHHVGDEAA